MREKARTIIEQEIDYFVSQSQKPVDSTGLLISKTEKIVKIVLTREVNQSFMQGCYVTTGVFFTKAHPYIGCPRKFCGPFATFVLFLSV